MARSGFAAQTINTLFGRATLETLDPGGTLLASEHIVLVWHSMGGVLSRFMISSSGEELWDYFFVNYPLQWQRLERYLKFEPIPQIKRVIFVDALHLGMLFVVNPA